jgi:hypothetical protein
METIFKWHRGGPWKPPPSVTVVALILEKYFRQIIDTPAQQPLWSTGYYGTSLGVDFIAGFYLVDKEA